MISYRTRKEKKKKKKFCRIDLKMMKVKIVFLGVMMMALVLSSGNEIENTMYECIKATTDLSTRLVFHRYGL